MSLQKFESLNEDIQDILDKVTKKLEARFTSKGSDEENKRMIQRLERSLEEAKFVLNKMEMEALHAPGQFQNRMHSTIGRHKEDIERNLKKLNELRYSHLDSQLPKSNTSSSSGSTNPLHDDVRKQILIGTSSLQRTSDSLARSEAVAIETEQLGTEVLGELSSQRETLERTRDRLVDTQDEIGRSKKALRSIAFSALFNKLLLSIIIGLEILILAGLVYWKFFT